MRRYLSLNISVLTLVVFLQSSTFAEDILTPQQEIDSFVPKAKQILDAFHGDKTKSDKKTLQIIYWTPSDREPAKGYRERLTRVLEHVQNFYRKEMKRIGFGEKTFNLEYDADKLIKIHLVKSEQPYKDYGRSSGNRIRQEAIPVLRKAGIDPNDNTLVIFCNMSNWDPQKKTISQNSPYYAGGNSLTGTAWQVDSVLLDPLNLSKKEPIVRDGEYGKISVGKYNSIFIGGVCHELGHALGLPHNKERPDEKELWGTALMGSGNRTYGDELRGEGKGSFLTLTHALRLANHAQFSDSTKTLSRKTTATIDNLEVSADEKSVTFKGKVQADPPAYAVIGYLDPTGGGNYNAFQASSIPDSEGNFSITFRPFKSKMKAEIRLIVCQVNGAETSYIGTHSPWKFPVEADSTGKPLVEPILSKIQLEPLVTALYQKDSQQVKEIMDTIQGKGSESIKSIAKRLVGANKKRKYQKSNEIPKELKEIHLTDLNAEEAKVGWLKPAVDRLPRAAGLLEANGKIYRSGIYAHAPSEYRYALDKQFKKLTGLCSLAAGQSGSVVFLIEADGKQLFKSPTIKQGTTKPFQVDLTGVAELKLIVTDGGDGASSDWGVWLEPKLAR